jgi:hypothetical protein
MPIQSVNLSNQEVMKRSQMTESSMQTRNTNSSTKRQCIIFPDISQRSGTLIFSMAIAFVVLTMGTGLQTVFIISETFKEGCQIIKEYISLCTVIRVVKLNYQLEGGSKIKMSIDLNA